MLQKLRQQERQHPRIQLNDRETIKLRVFESENNEVNVDEDNNGYVERKASHSKRVTIHMANLERHLMAKMILLPTTLEELLRIGGKHIPS